MARMYDPEIGRFIQADTIVPGIVSPQAWDRYSYVVNSPINRNDPSGHCFSGAVVDTVFCGIMAVGAITGGVYSYISQKNTTGIVDPEKVAYDSLTGAVIAGGVALASFAVSSAISSLLPIAIGACFDGNCTNELELSAKLGQRIWEMNPFERGRVIENALGKSPQLANNFPVIDRFENGVATSIKSIDLMAKTYQNVNTLISKVQGYVTTLANWQGTGPKGWGNMVITNSMIQGQELLLAIPPNSSQVQLAALQQLQAWAQTINVTLTITTIP